MDSPLPGLKAPSFQRETSTSSIDETSFSPRELSGFLLNLAEDERRSRSTTSLREHASPAMTSSDRDHIIRCIETLNLYHHDMISFDSHAAVREALKALVENFPNIKHLSEISTQIEILQESLMQDDRVNVGDLEQRVEYLLIALSALIEEITAISNVSHVAGVQFKASEDV